MSAGLWAFIAFLCLAYGALGGWETPDGEY